MDAPAKPVTLELPPDSRYLPSVTAAARTVAHVHGLDKDKTLRLNLAAEEIFLCLCRAAGGDEMVRVILTGGRSFARLAFRFRSQGVNLRALNSTAAFCADDEACPTDQGLLLASRTADRCRLDYLPPDIYVLSVEVDRTYPRLSQFPAAMEVAAPFRVTAEADGKIFAYAAAIAAGLYPAHLCPESLYFPERFEDELADGHFKALLCLDGASRPAGMICWKAMGERGLAFYGPYVFCAPQDKAGVARDLTEGFLAAVARTDALCVLSKRVNPDLPEGYFDILGYLTLVRGGEIVRQPVAYRYLHEDGGATVFAHPEVEPFVRAEYDRLAFCRDILPAKAQELDNPFSVLSTDIDQDKGQAQLSPLRAGLDLKQNLAGHVAALLERGLPNILFYLDMSSSWQSAMAADLLAAGFSPVLILPYAGRSDLLVFQYARPR